MIDNLSVVKSSLFVTLIIPLTAILANSAVAQIDHGEWDHILEQNVRLLDGGKATQFDYGSMARNRLELKNYLSRISQVSRQDFETWSHSDQLAFLINTYNAATVDLVLTEYPEIDSIKDIGFLFSSPWRQKVIDLFGEQVSLDDIEHGMIRGWGRYNEPRIHFVVNCAAVGCPGLRPEAFVGIKLEQQLEESAELFLSDSSRNYYSAGRLYISSIFNWYEEDFEQGWLGVNSVTEFLTHYTGVMALDADARSAIKKGQIRIRYLRYDWRLNNVD